MVTLPYLSGYSPKLQTEALALLEAKELLPRLDARYPDRHQIRSNRELSRYVQNLKSDSMRTAPPLEGATFDHKLRVIEGALGLHTTKTQSHGSKLKKRRSIRIASLFKEVAPEFLRMIVVHELAHMKHFDHDRAFYRLCTHIEPAYHQYELDLRLYLTAQEWSGREP